MSQIFDYANYGQKYAVTPIELFFDLIYAFAVSQLTQYLLSDLSWQGMLRTLVMLIPIYMVWAHTSWTATMIRADQTITRGMILLVMFFGLFMNASVARAFSSSGWLFAAAFLIIQLGRTCWTIVYSPNALFRDHFWRILLWQIFIAPFWIAGACVPGSIRIWFWLTAVCIDLLGAWLAHPVPGRRLFSEDVAFDADHFLERCRLFQLIAIGEMVFTLGAAIAAAPLNFMTLVLGTVTMAEIVSLWALIFGRVYTLTLNHLEKTRNPTRTSRYAIYALTIILFSLVAISATNEQIILHPFKRPSPVLSFLLGGGPILFLAAQGWYLITAINVRPRLYIICGLLLLLASIGSFLYPAWIALIVIGAILTAFAVLDSRFSK